MEENRAARRLCISVDMERYSRWDADDQKAAQDALAGVLERTCRDARLDRDTWVRQPGGDGELALLPPGTDESRAISGFVRNLTVHLYRHNRTLNEQAAIRLRIAMHVGMTEPAGMGYSGPVPVHAVRLRDSSQLRDVMAEHPLADFALAVSQTVYDEHIGHDYPDFRTGDFRCVRVEDTEKEFAAEAWVYVPPVTRSASSAPPVQQPRGPASPGVNVSVGDITVGQHAGRDIVNNYGPVRWRRDDD